MDALAGLLPELQCLTLSDNERLAESLPTLELALKSIGSHLNFDVHLEADRGATLLGCE